MFLNICEKLSKCAVTFLVTAILVCGVPDRGFAQDHKFAAEAEIRFQQMEKEIRRLTGQIEEQNYEIPAIA